MASMPENLDPVSALEIEAKQEMEEIECQFVSEAHNGAQSFPATKEDKQMVANGLEFVSGSQDCEEQKANACEGVLEIREYQEMAENEVDFGDCKNLKANDGGDRDRSNGRFWDTRECQEIAENERKFIGCKKMKAKGGGKCEKSTEGFSEMSEDQETVGNGREFVFGTQDCEKLEGNGGEGFLETRKDQEKSENEVEFVHCNVNGGGKWENSRGGFLDMRGDQEMAGNEVEFGDCEKLKADGSGKCEKNTERILEMRGDQEMWGNEREFVSEGEDREKRREALSEIKENGEMVENEIELVCVGQNHGELEVKDYIGCEGSSESLSEIKGDGEMVETEIKDKKSTMIIFEIKENQEMARCFLEINQVNEMAGTQLGFASEVQSDVKCWESSSEISVKQENEGNKRKGSKRRAKSTRSNALKINGKQEFQNVCKKKENGSGRSYSRVELQALRFVNVEEQDKKWNEIYLGLGSVARELDGIAATAQPKQGRKNVDRRQRKKKAAGILSGDGILDNCGDVFSQNIDNGCEEVHPVDLVSVESISGKENCLLEQHEHDESEDSDDAYDSIQRPAFLVEGEPDFESGPPQDGWEFLRRVRWEAAQIPKVKVAKVDSRKLNSQQTAYMPIIPDIPKCPVHLLPSKHWEDEFLTDFSELRLALSQLGNSIDWPEYTSKRDSSEDSGILQQPKDIPAVSTILGLDAVSRAAMLRTRINTFESASTLSRDDSLWLFALCAAVEKPLDAETSASVRCLLRKCSSLCAAKMESDDELVMLNMLITIAGKYFRQLEC